MEWGEASELADKIVATCELAFADNTEDCTSFVRAVAEQYFENPGFVVPGADCILDHVTNLDNGWMDRRSDPLEAIRVAKAGHFVIAGMRGIDFKPQRNHGHVAIVVGLDGKRSGSSIVPLCYAGGGGGPAVCGQRVSMTFPALAAQNGNIRYFSKLPDMQPNESAFEIVLDVLRAARSSSFKRPMYPPKSIRNAHRRLESDYLRRDGA